MPEPVPLEESAVCKFGYKHTVPQYGSDRRGKLENLKNSNGLCLLCVSVRWSGVGKLWDFT